LEIIIFFVRNDSGFGPFFNSNRISALSGSNNESEKILESLFDPDNAEILLELKNGPKPLSFLTKKIIISNKNLDEKLSYLMEKGFVSKNEKNDDIFYYLDTEKLSKVLENDDNFKNIDDGLAKLDSFLN
jgi:DNA-binding HxlR family transcriptional regulator